MDNNVEVSFNEILEFKYAMVIAANDSYMKDKEGNKRMQEKTGMIKKNLLENLSSFTRGELEYFFSNGENLCDGVGQILIYYYLCLNPEVTKIDEFIKCVESSEDIDVAKALFHRDYSSTIGDLFKDNSKLKTVDDVLAYFKKLKMKDKSKMKKHLECIENCEEVRQRFIILIKAFYTRSYRKVLNDVEEILKPYIDEYDEELRKDHGKFIKKYIGIDNSFINGKFNVFISLSKGVSADCWVGNYLGHDDFAVLGCYTKEVLDEYDGKDKILDFLKVVGDSKRLQIISILKKGPAYVAEIADKMNMTSPTACYHLSALQSFEIVEFSRSDHRFYYSLNKEKLKEWFEKASDFYCK